MGVWVRMAGLASLVLGISTAFLFLGIPLPTLSGGLLGAAFFALSTSRTTEFPPIVEVSTQAAIGALVGMELNSSALPSIAEDWLPLSCVTLLCLVSSALLGQLLVLGGVSRSTASFSAVAGGAAGMIPLSRELGADDRVVAALQYLRVGLIILLLPPVVSIMAATTVEAPESAGLDGNATSWAGMAFIAIVCVMTVAISAVAHAGAHAVLVGLVLGWALAAVPALGGAPVPEWLAALAFLLLGAGIGLRFTGDVAKQILRLMPLALLVLVLVLMSCAASGALLSLWTGKSWMDGYLATTPGGVPAVLAAGAATSADITFVSAAQIFRLLMVLGFAPLLVKLIMRAR